MADEKVVEMMAAGIWAAMSDKVAPSSAIWSPQSSYYARAALAALEKEGYMVRRYPGFHADCEDFVFENCRMENGVVVGPADPTKPYRYPRNAKLSPGIVHEQEPYAAALSDPPKE